MKTLVIKDIFKQDYITREAGEELRTLILENYNNKQETTLDFSDIIIASTSFFDEGIAKLALEGWDKKTYNKFIIIKDINRMDMEVLNKMLKYRKLI